MVIALSAVGTGDIANGEKQQEQLTQLIAGTLTSLVSSLVELMAAFTAHLLKVALKRKGVVSGHESIGLSEAVGQLKTRIAELNTQFGFLVDRPGGLSDCSTRLPQNRTRRFPSSGSSVSHVSIR
jgi:hypothetical protein